MRLTERSVSPYAEWGLLIPRILILGANRVFKNHGFNQPVTEQANAIANEQVFTLVRKIVPSAVGVFLPTVGKFCDYGMTGVEMICRTFYILPNKAEA